MGAVPPPPIRAATSEPRHRGNLRVVPGLGVIGFQAMVLFIWLTIFGSMGLDLGTLTVIGVGGIIWCAASIPLLMQYRHGDTPQGRSLGDALVLPIAISCSAVERDIQRTLAHRRSLPLFHR